MRGCLPQSGRLTTIRQSANLTPERASVALSASHAFTQIFIFNACLIDFHHIEPVVENGGPPVHEGVEPALVLFLVGFLRRRRRYSRRNRRAC